MKKERKRKRFSKRDERTHSDRELLRMLWSYITPYKRLFNILIVLLVSMLFIKRPFCRTLCPLGALYGLFNKISFIRMEVDQEKCIQCKTCQDICPVSYDIFADRVGSGNCIRCFKCRKECPVDAIKITVKTQIS